MSQVESTLSSIQSDVLKSEASSMKSDLGRTSQGKKNAPSIAVAITQTVPALSSAWPKIVDGLGELGTTGKKFAGYAALGLGAISAAKSYIEQVDAGECQ